MSTNKLYKIKQTSEFKDYYNWIFIVKLFYNKYILII
jgi:hypothetical protein